MVNGIANFNSIKVRLKHKPAVDVLNISFGFQFHKGTIKTAELISTGESTLEISIP